MGIKQDLITSHSLSLDSDGYTTERSFLVDGVGGTAESKLYNAITQPGIPQINDPHPILPDVRVTKLSARPQGSGSDIRVIASYSIPKTDDAIQDAQQDQQNISSVNLSTSLASEQTWFDINGDFLTAQYVGGILQTAYKQADVQRPQLQISFKRIENTLPKSIISNYLGRVNSVPWSGFPAKTWLCTKVDATEDREGKFNVDYGFSYKPDTWRLEIVLNLTPEQIAELPPDKDSGNGYARYDVYRGADFNALGLSF